MMNYHRRIDRLDRLIATTDEIPELPPRQPFDWERYHELWAEIVADWTPAECEAAERWYSGERAGRCTRDPGPVVVAAEQAFIGVLRERDRDPAKRRPNSGVGPE